MSSIVRKRTATGRLPRLGRQSSGQSSVFVLLFLPVLVIGLIFMFNAGKLTTRKMELQNAADAAAYSASVIEARDMNFASYMNRAIVANEVGIGQLVGLASWAHHFASMGEYLGTYLLGLCVGSAGFVCQPYTGSQSIRQLWGKIGRGATKVFDPIAQYGAMVLSIVNQIYGYAEFGHHVVTLYFVGASLDQVITDNAPAGTSLSEFGVISLIAHFKTYGAIPTPTTSLNLNRYDFTESNWPPQDIEQADLDQLSQNGSADNGFGGYGRLAALIRESRDPFTAGPGPFTQAELTNPTDITDPNYDPDAQGNYRGWELHPPGFPLSIPRWTNIVTIPLGPLGDAGMDMYFYLDIYLQKKGGSELRFVQEEDQGDTAGHLNWSAADTSGLTLDLAGGFQIWYDPPSLLVTDPPKTTIVGADLQLINARLRIAATIAGQNITFLNMPFPNTAPFGAGFVQAASPKTDGGNKPVAKLTVPLMLPEDLGGVVPMDSYGGSPPNMLAWNPFPCPATPPYGSGVPIPRGVLLCASPNPPDDKRRVNKTYSALPMYVDSTGNTTGNGSMPVFGAPALFIGLVLDKDEFKWDATGQPPVNPPSGRFDVDEVFGGFNALDNDEEIAVLAKSDLYFKRPTDVRARHFWRADRQEEYGSAFNPYWNARLVETSWADRVLALLIQQGEDFSGVTQAINAAFATVSNAFNNALATASRALSNLMRQLPP
jgi:hypothetical protein